jgi:hypothetical protein
MTGILIGLLLISYTALGFHIEADYSTFSGLVTNIGLGSGPQRLRASLDFVNQDSIMFTQEACPPFVPACFEAQHSVSFEKLSPPTEFEWGMGFAAKDTLYIGGIREDVFRFIYTGIFKSDRVSGHEVSGVVSMTKNSDITEGKIIELTYEEQSGLSLRELDRPSLPVGMISAPSYSEKVWDIRGEVQIKNAAGLGAMTIIFDPSSQVIWFPVDMHDTLEHYVGSSLVIRKEVVYLSCEVTVPLSIRLETGLLVNIPFVLIQYPEETSDYFSFESDGFRFCPVRLRLSSKVSHVVIGRQLIESVKAIILNYRDSILGLIPRTQYEAAEPFVPSLSIPLFSAPTARGTTELLFQPTTQISEYSLALHSKRPIRLSGYTAAWIFIKHPFELYPTEGPVVQRLVDGFFSEVTLQMVGPSLVLTVTPTQPVRGRKGLQLVLVDYPDKFEVRIVECESEDILVPIGRLNLPAPQAVDVPNRECNICLEQMGVEGNIVQRITPCGHCFHFTCIRDWLETRSRTCPCCRQCVAIRQDYV